jgi:hypothetical protein
MPPTHLHPGVFIEELNVGGRAISGVPTSTTAFVGRTRRGPVERPRLVGSVPEFERIFGGLWPEAPLGYAVRQYFDNGGREALICRIRNGRLPLTDASVSDPGLEAERRGLWALDRVPRFDILVIPPLGPDLDVGRVTWDAAVAYARRRRAMLIVDPPAAWQRPEDGTPAALAEVITPDDALANAAIYFPRLVAVDPVQGGTERSFAPSGAIAGVYARTDARRGVWKAPAGVEANLVGVTGLAATLTDADTERLNPRGINVLRTFTQQGTVVWGARTLHGADELASDWKYVPVRRMALYLEESIVRGIQWATFEPNDEPLWAALRENVGSFLYQAFRAGAFQGQTPREAYFVRCDRSTTTQADIDNGVVRIQVGFAPLKPAEFVVITIRQRTRGADT